MSAETKFAEAVATFSHGNRYDRYLSTVRLGLIARNGDETAVFDYIMTNAPTPSPDPAKIRSAIRYALAHPLPDQTFTPSRRGDPILTPQERAEARRLLLPKSARDFVPVTLRKYAKTAFTGTTTADIFAEAIRLPDDLLHDPDDPHAPINYPKQAARQLRALFRPGDLIWAGTIIQDEAVRARLGYRYAKTPIKPAPGDNIFDPAVRAGIIEAHVLADRIEKGIVAKIPTHVSLNPVTGKSAQTSGSSPSYDCAATIAAYRHVIVEWDKLFDLDAEGVKTPSQTHIETVAGLIDYAFETDRIRPLVAVYTGGKSIHIALRVKADDLAAYKRQTDALRDLFASADDETFRADPTGWDNGYTHIRLAGAIRPETGRRARLLWSNP